jgi:BirA family biotin operon repressor/biotin-[acetyl-CoA-carboxylase] ligase
VSTPPSARSPLEPHQVAEAAGPAWDVLLLPEAGSTNAVAAEDPVPGRVVVADHQRAGRGRLDRTWETPAGSALTFTAVVQPRVPDAGWPLLPLAAALATVSGLRSGAGVEPLLKWPNDVLLGPEEGKVAGILLERVHSATGPLALVGIGINVAMRAEELPVPTATSVAIAGGLADRTVILGAVLTALAAELDALRQDPHALLERYRGGCVTLGRRVRVDLPDGSTQEGVAEAVDDHGRLVVSGRAVGAGDVVHVRPA